MDRVIERIKILKGDITKVSVEIIVNAANSSLLGGGGVDGAIHKAGGKGILEECMRIRDRQGKCKTGEAVITTAGKLSAKYIIHTVGPVWNGGNSGEDSLLKSCYLNSLELCVKSSAKTIAFPNISTGIFKFPRDKACLIALESVVSFLKENDSIEKVLFVCYDDENYQLYLEKIKSYS